MIGSQADYAKHAGISRQAVSKAVKAERIPIRPDGKIDFAEADLARNAVAVPTTENPNPANGEQPEAAQNQGGFSYADHRAAREEYQAKLARLQYEREIGELLPLQEVEAAIVEVGRKIQQSLDSLTAWADELDAAARNGGADGVRSVLKAKVRDLEKMTAESLNVLGDGHSEH